jgi:hypothetical protein
MARKSLLAFLLAPLFAFGQGSQLPKYTVAHLPSASANPTMSVQVIDGSTASDCTMGGGSYNVICSPHGGVWIAVTGSGSGTVSGQANGVIPLATGSTVIGAQSPLSVNSGNVVSSDPIVVGTAPAIGVSIGPLGSPTNWNLDTTSPATALASALGNPSSGTYSLDCVTSTDCIPITSGAFTIIAPSGDTTGATDCAAINTAIQTCVPTQLKAGTYYTGHSGCTITFTKACTLQGVGSSLTKIQNEGATNNVVAITNGGDNANLAHSTPTVFRDVSIIQDPLVTHTAGSAILLGNNTTATSNVHIDDVQVLNTFQGVNIGPGTYLLWFTNSNILSAAGHALILNNPLPYGDLWVNNDQLADAATDNVGVEIDQSDTTEFAHIKLNGNYIKFYNTGITQRVRFTDSSIEGPVSGSPLPCGVDLGLGTSLGSPIPTQIQFNGGMIDTGVSAVLCSPGHSLQLQGYLNANTTSTSAIGMFTFGFNGPNTVSDNFGNEQSSAVLNPLWWNITIPSFAPFEGAITGTTTSTVSQAIWEANGTFPANQTTYGSFISISNGNAGGIELVDRSDSTSANLYGLYIQQSGIQIGKKVSGTFAAISGCTASVTSNTGDYFSFTVSGASPTTLSATRNGTAITLANTTTTCTDSSSPITSGQPGIGVNSLTSGGVGIANWSATSP